MGSVILSMMNSTRPPIVGKLQSMPKRGHKLTIEYDDGMYEYVTTPVIRIFHLLDTETFYVETANNRYRLRVKR